MKARIRAELRRIATRERGEAESALIAIGLPVVDELIHGKVSCPPGMHPKDFFEEAGVLISRIAERHPAAFVEFVCRHPKATTVSEVIAALGILPSDDRTRRLLEQALRSPDPYMRQTAAWAMGQTGDPAFTQALIAAARDRSRLVSRSVAEALGHCGDHQADAVLDGLAKRSRLETERADALEALCRLRRRLDLPLPPLRFSDTESAYAYDSSHLAPEVGARLQFELRAKVGDLVERDAVVAVMRDPAGERPIRAPFFGRLSVLEERESGRLDISIRRALPA